ncbi:AsnC family transcriptional regulator [Kineobactrum sediminis]|uniref:AsnC family transcriptional regulator n=1 Tax=Kineobactrum sediminis TaxID=1905677 RepID=A0A2N5Y3W5_9GAMM|nr:Lrp/AsnC family transcriptional regulator [Kineobactrum sediminis]PLW83057.1 AsnC family transcriptional regulator [Kineobactrum sediminis]
MDRTDIRILQTLQQQGRVSNQRLAEIADISPAACWRRMKALEDSGVIEGYTAILNRARVNLNLCAFIHITLARHVRESTAEFEAAVMQRSEVMECFVTTGEADFILRVVTTNIESFDAFVEGFLFTLPQISQIKSNIALREIKLTTALPIAQDSPPALRPEPAR